MDEDELKRLRAKYVGKLARLMNGSNPYSNEATGIVEEISEYQYQAGIPMVKFVGRLDKWYFDSSGWSLELHPGQTEGVSRD